MPTHTNGEAAPGGRGPVDRRLARLLDAPLLARVTPHLAPETLHQLIQHCGLEACGQLVTSATPAQLTAVLDIDLWRPPQPGRDGQFDVGRFGEWLELLAGAGSSVAARTVAALERDLVVVGLSRYLRVFDPGTFEPTESSDDEPMDRHEMMNSGTGRDAVECEVGGYLVRARRTGAWDAIVTLLVALDAEHNACFHSVMEGCRRLSHSRPEIDGLDDLLMAPEQHLHDVSVERDRRRSLQGYATPADARAFLQMARQRRAAAAQTAPINPIALAYFREADEAEAAPGGASADALEPATHDGTTDAARVSAGSSPSQGHGDDDAPTSVGEVIELLEEAGMLPERPRALLESPERDAPAASLPHLRRLMEFVLRHDESAYLTRSRELAFLANALLAGSSVQSRPFTPREASDAAACICNLGLECWPAARPGAPPHGAPSPRRLDTNGPADALLVDHDLVTVFEVGWSLLYRDVNLFVTDRLVAILADLDCADADIRRGLHALRRTLVKQRRAGTPWLARDAADVLGMLDMPAWIGVRGLLDECPIFPEALTAVVERRTTPVSPTAFAFISTRAQIDDIRLFMEALPSVLAG